ncbi:unnamed protein product [Bemisia tabaci]|uniref:Uncharacterized protein n=1 Tax=Bemisia tabaci TaxID=7038 RepID=A0A9P0F7R0_BEMTA|nr:PREDICTED: serine/arginine repetitive matrix protein 1 [Bemisia tabaci]XP_018908617.1 PREDICTED: serine/arginine repetitive matrix protein 1 [Bemisia tabaci]XP_018908618.1 PREDICTED: serine/arginine repetitive matrix protein 1 [Bemisia tabaci]CAH0393214.1 unnamed protein product [Bemisia tabaci]
MSSRRSREREKTRLRMDEYSGKSSGRRGLASPPRRRELDNMMKKARKDNGSQSQYWNKKLLEVEEKDPNRWRHTGFKKMYVDKEKRGSSHSRSPLSPMGRNSYTRSPPGRLRSPVPRPRSPSAKPPRSPIARARSPVARARSPVPRARSPVPRARSPVPRARSPVARVRKLSSPPARRRSESGSSGSLSSCSDSHCSVCSPKPKSRERVRKERLPPKEPRLRPRSPLPRPPPPRSRSRSFSVPRSSVRPDPRLRAQNEKLKEKQRKSKQKKRDRERSLFKPRPIKTESNSDDSSSPSPQPRMTLSERFGRMAQWSIDRDLEHHRNLKITSGDQFTVEMDSPPSPFPGPSSAALAEGSWDDVRTRYAYYKKQGYLRDLSLSDYVKWEEWWYKYQDWLDNERCRRRYQLLRKRH